MSRAVRKLQWEMDRDSGSEEKSLLRPVRVRQTPVQISQTWTLKRCRDFFQISEVYGLSNSKTTETLSLDIGDKARRKLRGEWACEKGRCHCGTLPGLKQRKVWGARQKRIDCKGTDRNSSYTDASVGLMQRGRTSQNKLPFRQCPMGCYTETLSGIHGTIEAFGSPCVPLDFF